MYGQDGSVDLLPLQLGRHMLDNKLGPLSIEAVDYPKHLVQCGFGRSICSEARQ